MTFVAQELTQQQASEYTSNIRSQVFSLQETFVFDRERNIALLALGGRGNLPKVRGEPPTYYALFWDGQEIDLQAWYSFAPDDVLNVEVASMLVPGALAMPLVEVEQAFIEALEAYWRKLGGRPVQVRATFDGIERC